MQTFFYQNKKPKLNTRQTTKIVENVNIIQTSTSKNKWKHRGSRGGGVFFTSDGLLETTFTWGLGEDTNNMVEALAIWQGLRIAKTHGSTKLTVLRDFRIIIQALNENLIPNQMHLKRLINKFKVLELTFSRIEFYHVLQKNNKDVDQAANLGSSLSPGELKINGFGTICIPP